MHCISFLLLGLVVLGLVLLVKITYTFRRLRVEFGSWDFSFFFVSFVSNYSYFIFGIIK